MKVFISWSGDQSHTVATTLRDWLPSVIQSIEPYVSSEDIDKGARWTSDIVQELEDAAFGLLCVSKSNIGSAWLNFEAGALGKSVGKSRVCPFLFRVRRSEVEGPLLQFQSTIYEKNDILKLLKSINAACGDSGIEEGRLETAFFVWWPKLHENLEKIPEESSDDQEEKPVKGKQTPLTQQHFEGMIEEILDLTRMNQRLLRSPEELFPEAYLRKVTGYGDRLVKRRDDSLDHPAIGELLMLLRNLLRKLEGAMSFCPDNERCRGELQKALRPMLPLLDFIESDGKHMSSSIRADLMEED